MFALFCAAVCMLVSCAFLFSFYCIVSCFSFSFTYHRLTVWSLGCCIIAHLLYYFHLFHSFFIFLFFVPLFIFYSPSLYIFFALFLFSLHIHLLFFPFSSQLDLFALNLLISLFLFSQYTSPLISSSFD